MLKYLACEQCRVTLYEVDYHSLGRPLLASMFKPRGGIAVRWKRWAGQDDMICPNCGRHVSRKIDHIWTTDNKGQFKLVEAPDVSPIVLPDGTRKCPKCNRAMNVRGIKTHIRFCDGGYGDEGESGYDDENGNGEDI